MQQAVKHRYVVVEGPIGVGKTTLAKRLAETWGAEPMLEQAEANPFLERFYRDPVGAALPTQLHFLFQRTQQLADLRQQDLFTSAVRVADYLIEKDRLFARSRRASSRSTSRSTSGSSSIRRSPTSSSTCRRPSTCCSSASLAAASRWSSSSTGHTSRS